MPSNSLTHRILLPLRTLLASMLLLSVFGSQAAKGQLVASLAPISAASSYDSLPDSPGFQASVATLSGTVTDIDGDSVLGARVVLIRDGQPRVEMRTTSDGRFSFSAIAAGAYRLRISAPGFAVQRSAGEIAAGATLNLTIALTIASSNAEVQVTASQSDIAEAQIQDQEKQRVLGFLPNFYVSYIPNPVPLHAKQKFELAYKTFFDPVSFGVTGLVAGIQQATNTYSSWGQDAPSYGKRYAAAYGTFLTSTLLGNAVFPVLFKQDPRYFYKGTGTVRARALYAMANAVICKGDNMRWQPNYSAVLGGLAAAGLSNAYYPAADREGAGLTFANAAIGTAGTAVGNLFQEFVVPRFTRHLPTRGPAKAASSGKP